MPWVLLVRGGRREEYRTWGYIHSRLWFSAVCHPICIFRVKVRANHFLCQCRLLWYTSKETCSSLYLSFRGTSKCWRERGKRGLFYYFVYKVDLKWSGTTTLCWLPRNIFALHQRNFLFICILCVLFTDSIKALCFFNYIVQLFLLHYVYVINM